MSGYSSSKDQAIKAKSKDKKSIQSADTDDIHALKERLAQLSSENQLLKRENEQRATELQIINNIGQTLTEGLDLNSTLEYVTERLHEVLRVENIAITIVDPNTDMVKAQYFHGDRASFTADRFSLRKYKLGIRLSMKGKGRSWVVNTNVEKSWLKFAGDFLEGDPVPKTFILLPLLAGNDAIGGITIAEFENENAFDNISTNLLETIASNLGTAIQNTRLFDETQRLLKETEKRTIELQIINNIGQTLTEGLDLQSTIEHVGERLQDILKVQSIAIAVSTPEVDSILAQYIYHKGQRIEPNEDTAENFKFAIRFAARWAGKSWVASTSEKYLEKYIRKFAILGLPKSFAAFPLLSGGEVIGGITIADDEREDAFTDLPIDMLETISSNMGTAIQNVRLFDETQRLLKVTEQRATELQIVNNIGQTLTEGLDLQNTLDRVGERLRDVLKIDSIGVVVFNPKSDLGTSYYLYSKGKRVTAEHFSFEKFRLGTRLSARGSGRSWVVNTNAEKIWQKFGAYGDDVAKSFVMFPLLAGREVIGGITIADYEKENAFIDLPISMLETIASNMGTAIQNVRLFDETQRLLKETAQRATELQIINNIGQTLTESGDLKSMIQRVGERIQEVLNINDIAISIFDKETDRVIAPYMVRNGEQISLTEEIFDVRSYKIMIRASARRGGVSWVVKGNDMEKFWHRWRGSIGNDVPKSVVVLPLLAGREVIGGISLADYEKENAFTDISLNLLETIASNMGTAVQNVRLFEETKRLFAEAEEARTAAEQANKAKSTFLANMSHELRTPLNAIMGFTQIVKGKAEGVLPEKQIGNLDKVLTSSQHLLGLINTVLDIAKIEAGRMDVIPGKFSLGGFADQCMALATPLLKPNVTLEKQVDETIGFVFSDQDKIKQIILNLLSNAAKFTHEGIIILRVEKLTGEMISISVKDSGIGISEEALGRVFEEFQQAETTTTRQYGGTGLGLTISRNLARLLGGDLTAASVLGEGSTFTLTFPMRYEKDNALQQPQDSTSSAAIVDTVHSAEAASAETGTKKNGQPSKTILVVEDTELNINFITQLLEDDYNLIFAQNGAQGVTLAELEKPDLILMDISLPIMDGYEATRRIRINMSSVPIIGLSAYAMIGDAEKAKEAGCNDYITKPVDGNLLKKKIVEYLR